MAIPHHSPERTWFLDAQDMARLVRGLGLPACIAGIARQVERDFRRWNDFDKSARVAAHSPQGVIELMPVSDRERFAFKYVNGHPDNAALGLPTVMAFGVLADVATGEPRVLAELTLATALRTAAVSALAARRLARPGARTLALIGNGAQAEFQALAFRDLLGVQSLRLFDIDPTASRRVAARLDGAGLPARVCASAAEAVRGADIVTTATADKRRARVLEADMLAPGMHLNAIGGDCPGKTELAPEAVRRCEVFVEYEPQTRVEGEIQQMPVDFPVTELWRVLSGMHPGRADAAQLTLFDSVGFALEDLSALGWLAEAAQAQGIGRPIALVPALDDPRDLYGALLAPPGTPAPPPPALMTAHPRRAAARGRRAPLRPRSPRP